MSSMFNQHLKDNIKGRERRPNIAGFIPQYDSPKRQSFVYVTMVLWYSMHLLFTAFGFSALLAFGSSLIISIVFGSYFSIFLLLNIVYTGGDMTPYFKLPRMISIIFALLWVPLSMVALTVVPFSGAR